MMKMTYLTVTTSTSDQAISDTAPCEVYCRHSRASAAPNWRERGVKCRWQHKNARGVERSTHKECIKTGACRHRATAPPDATVRAASRRLRRLIPQAANNTCRVSDSVITVGLFLYAYFMQCGRDSDRTLIRH